MFMNEQQLVSESHEQEQKPQILLEIGHSTRSLAEHAQMAFGEGQLYVGMELPESNKAYKSHFEFNQDTLDQYREALKSARPNENIQFITGDARAIPLAPASVDKVFMANVTDSPLRVSTPRFFDELMLSVRQVLKPDGEVVVFEDRTPEDTGQPHDAKLRQLRMLGFDSVRHIGNNDPGFEDMRKQYGMNHNMGRLLIPLIDESWKEQVAKTRLKHPDWSPRAMEAHNGDYFMVLRKSQRPPEISTAETSNSWDMAWNEILEEELRIKDLDRIVSDKKRLERDRLEARLRTERQKELAIKVGKTFGRAALRGISKLHKSLK